jgi:hypothetical protein
MADARQLAFIELLVTEMDTIENALAALDEDVKVKKARLRDIQLNQLPEAMTEAEVTEFEFEGRKVILDQEVHSNISEKNRPEAFAWLKANGYGDVLQYEFKIKIPRKLREAINKIRPRMQEMITELGLPLEFEEKATYSGQSLIKVIKDMRKAGKEIPEIIGTFDPLVAKWEKTEVLSMEIGE